LAVFQLVDRFATSGMTMRQLADLLERPIWLKREGVGAFWDAYGTALGGHFGFREFQPFDTVVIFPRLPKDDGSHIDLLLDGVVSAKPYSAATQEKLDELYVVLAGGDSPAGRMRIRDFFVMPRDPAEQKLVYWWWRDGPRR
jgi:hypothetical protein